MRSGELRKNGSRIRLQAQPFQLLALLLQNSGEVVPRDEICSELSDGRYMLYSQLDENNSNIMLVSNFL